MEATSYSRKHLPVADPLVGLVVQAFDEQLLGGSLLQDLADQLRRRPGTLALDLGREPLHCVG
jgi:hypothetical protein